MMPNCIAFLDLETTGLDPTKHEILQIGIVRVDAMTLTIHSQIELKVIPVRIIDAEAKALEVNGYREELWIDAVPLRDALMTIRPWLEGAVLAGHNPGFDAAFLAEGYRSEGVSAPTVDHHKLDTASLAWPLWSSGDIESPSLSSVCNHLGIDRPTPHGALADARASLDVARKIMMPEAVLETRVDEVIFAWRKFGLTPILSASLTDLDKARRES
jgi:DNA polymerase-3 subunit epsilon